MIIGILDPQYPYTNFSSKNVIICNPNRLPIITFYHLCILISHVLHTSFLLHIYLVVEVYVQSGGSGALDPGSHKGGKAVSHSVCYSDTL